MLNFFYFEVENTKYAIFLSQKNQIWVAIPFRDLFFTEYGE